MTGIGEVAIHFKRIILEGCSRILMVKLRVKEAEVPPLKALQNWTSNMFTLLSVEDQGFTPRWVDCTMSLGLWQNPIAGEKKSEKKIDIEFSLNTVKEKSR